MTMSNTKWNGVLKRSMVSVAVLIFFESSISEPVLRNQDGLKAMAELLNREAPQFKKLYDPKGFYIEDSRPVNFFVYDLVDPSSNAYPATGPVKLKSEGIYHFSPVQFEFSFSHIAVIKDRKMKIFSYLNCNNSRDKIDDVLEYVTKNFSYDESVLDRITSYRFYGHFEKTDDHYEIECP